MQKRTVKKMHLLKDKGKDLGVQISGGSEKKVDKGIYVSHIMDEGAAARYFCYYFLLIIPCNSSTCIDLCLCICVSISIF